MTAIEYLDRPEPGWFVFEVMRREERSWNWVALMVDYDPDKGRPCFGAGHSRWLQIPGKHRIRHAAWDALEEMIERQNQAEARRAAFAVVPKD